jgi:hypothetical protein
MIGKGPVYIYDNERHDNKWWYELSPGQKIFPRKKKNNGIVSAAIVVFLFVFNKKNNK